MVLPQRTYFTPDVPAPSCPFSPLAPCDPCAPVFPTAPWSPFGPGGPGNGFLVPGFPCSPTKYKMTQRRLIPAFWLILVLKSGIHKSTFFSYVLLTIHICFHACSGWKLTGLQLIHSMIINCKNRKRNTLSENNWDANLTSVTAFLLYCRLTSNCWNIQTEITKRVSFALSTAFTVGVIQFSFFPWYLRSCRFPFYLLILLVQLALASQGGRVVQLDPFQGFAYADLK